jgi:outer membrane immunogenic protein
MMERVAVNTHGDVIMKFGLAVVAVLASVSVASAADVLPAATKATYKAAVASPGYDWSGFYIGAMGGYGWSGSNFNGGFAGGTFGGNAQFGNLVVGGELEGAWANLTGSATAIPGVATVTDTMGSFGSATVRIGYAAGNVLFYGKGGAAIASNKIGINVLGVTLSDTQTHYGYTVGGSIEYGLTPNWSVKGEYLYTNYQSANYFASIPGGPVASGSFYVNSVKLGVNYRFGWGAPVVAKY